MRNENILYAIIILFLGLCAYKLSNIENSITRIDRRDFAVSDTSEVIKIILSSKIPEVATLERVNQSSWTINGAYKARKSGIFYLLQTLQRMEIAYPVPINMRDNVIGNLAVKGIKVEVFLKDGKEKTLYVGGENKELTATFMMLKSAKEPYAVHIPGFQGYLSGRFYTQEYLWRDKVVMNYDNQNIASIQMQYHKTIQKHESFQITHINNRYELSDFNTGKIIDSNQKKIEQYMASFRKLYAEGFVTGTLNKDSLLHTQPLFDLTVNTKDHQSTHIKVFNKKAKKTIYIDGDISLQDPDRLFTLVNNKDWMVIQTNTFNKVMKKLSELKN
tara:strand:+ start:452 stop:1444 length:993 start_codon:yes stop_codon:yes gene_type:complete